MKPIHLLISTKWQHLNKRNISLLCVLLTLLSLSAYSQDSGINNSTTSEQEEHEQVKATWNRFQISFGGFFAGYNSGITLGLEQIGAGVSVDLEEALGLNTSGWVLRGDAMYTFGKRKRSAVRVGFFDINRSASLVLDETLEIGETEFPIGTTINSKFDMTIIRAKYSYAFIHDDRVSFAVSGGFFILPLSFGIEALGLEAQRADFVAPLPVVGLRIVLKLIGKFSLYNSSEILYLSTSEIGGSILDFNFRLSHSTFDHFGFGLALNTTRINVYSRSSSGGLDFVGDAKMEYTGIALYGSFYF